VLYGHQKEVKMKTTILSTVAILTAATVAYAADLPKKTTPPVPTASSTSVAAPADTTLSFGFGMEADTGTYDKANKYVYKLGIEHNVGSGFFVGGNAETSQVQPNDGAIKQNLEALGGYKMPLGPVTIKGSFAVGERFTTGNNFPYYAARVGADYKVTEALTWNAVQYRYRNSFDHSANAYESHQIGTGLTFDFAKNQAVFANFYRNLDSSYAATDNGVTMGYKVAF